MRLLGTALGVALCLLLGMASGVAALAVHRSLPGLLLGVGTAVVVVRTLRLWWPGAGQAFAGGWLVLLVVAVAGRGEGDYVVSSDLLGWSFVASGFVVLVTALASGPPRMHRHDSASAGVPT